MEYIEIEFKHYTMELKSLSLFRELSEIPDENISAYAGGKLIKRIVWRVD